MNARRMAVVFSIALTVSALCTWIFSRKLTAAATNAGRIPTRKYVTAAKLLQPGEVLRTEDLAMTDWPDSSPIVGGIMQIESAIGRSVLYPVEKNQPITEKLLSTPGSGSGLSGRISQGMRAIALHSDEVMGVAGFLFPGSRVDVMVTYRSQESPEPTTLTVLQNAEVLAIGQKNQPDPEGKPLTVTVVTLLLSPEDAQRAVLASAQGAIHFVLRGASDSTHVDQSPLMLSHLAGPVRAVPVSPRQPRGNPARNAPNKTIVVQTFAGDKHYADTFNGVE